MKFIPRCSSGSSYQRLSWYREPDTDLIRCLNQEQFVVNKSVKFTHEQFVSYNSEHEKLEAYNWTSPEALLFTHWHVDSVWPYASITGMQSLLAALILTFTSGRCTCHSLCKQSLKICNLLREERVNSLLELTWCLLLFNAGLYSRVSFTSVEWNSSMILVFYCTWADLKPTSETEGAQPCLGAQKSCEHYPDEDYENRWNFLVPFVWCHDSRHRDWFEEQGMEDRLVFSFQLPC